MCLKRSRWWLRKGQLSLAGVEHHTSPFCFFLHFLHLHALSRLLSIFHTCPPVAHPFLLISLAFYVLVAPFSISIVLFYTTREACSLTQASDNWHSWGWTFRSSPIHMYSKQRDKSHLTLYRPHPPCMGSQMSWVNLSCFTTDEATTLLVYTM